MTAGRSKGEFTKSYARWRSRRLGQITDRLEQGLLFNLLESVSGKTLLDVGCGDAVFALDIARRGGLVTGLDADPTMIAAAERRAQHDGLQLRLIVGRAENLPFNDAAFDLVVAVTTLCFVRDAEGAVKEMARVLKPGGSLIIGELGRWSLWSAYRRIRGWLGDPTWRRAKFRSATELHNLVAAAGLKVTTTRGAVHYPPCGIAARLLAPIDLWLGRRVTFGSAFIALSASNPAGP